MLDEALGRRRPASRPPRWTSRRAALRAGRTPRWPPPQPDPARRQRPRPASALDARTRVAREHAHARSRGPLGRAASAELDAAAAPPGRSSPAASRRGSSRRARCERGAATLKALKDAEKWVKERRRRRCGRERFAPISERAIENWRELRQGSSVDLHEITLKKVGRGGRADFDVRADGEDANALGVMSQGELLALSVSVFLPRAALDESPFRFAVIDDPVQAMDPAKVDGLARVLHRAARTRQIVVFTHDDRLPEAIRRLRLDATMLHVDRRARSAVDVQISRTPGPALPRRRPRLRAPDRLPPEVQARVVPMFCRSAVEAAAANIVRRRAAERGHEPRRGRRADRARRARCARRSRSCCSATRAARARSADEIRRRYGAAAAALVTELNRGAHGRRSTPATLERLPTRTRDFIHELMA